MHLARTTRRLALLAALGGAALSATTGIAQADSVCSYDASLHRVNVWDGSGDARMKITRKGQYIVVANGANVSYCSSYNGVATVTNTDKIIVDGHASGVWDGFVIDQSNGELGPGFTAEGDGKSEIEVVMRNKTGADVEVIGTPGADTVKFGGKNLVMLGNDSDIDANLISSTDGTALVASFEAKGGAGNDYLSAAGGYGYSSFPPAAVGYAELAGGDGNDTLQGGDAFDKLFGQGNDDYLYAVGGGFDLVEGGTGFDRAVLDASDAYGNDIEQKTFK